MPERGYKFSKLDVSTRIRMQWKKKDNMRLKNMHERGFKLSNLDVSIIYTCNEQEGKKRKKKKVSLNRPRMHACMHICVRPCARAHL